MPYAPTDALNARLVERPDMQAVVAQLKRMIESYPSPADRTELPRSLAAIELGDHTSHGDRFEQMDIQTVRMIDSRVPGKRLTMVK